MLSKTTIFECVPMLLFYHYTPSLCISLCWKKMFALHSLFLQQSSNRSLPFSLTSASPCLPITRFHIPASFPNMCIEVPQKDNGFFKFNLSQGIISFFHKLRVLYTCVWAIYLYQKQGAV